MFFFPMIFSTYAEIQSEKDDDPKDLIDRYLKFQKDFDQAILIIQSMSRQKQLDKVISKTATERKQCASSWIKAALYSDLSKYPNQIIFDSMITTPLDETISESKIVSPVSCCHKRLRKNCDNLTEQNALSAVIELANALRNESAGWFLKYVEKFLDAVEACESHVGGLLCQMKKLDDWLNEVVKKEKAVVLVDRNKDGAMLSEEEENDSCERVRKKIYGVLLRHVESAAVALESISATDEEKERILIC
jgi:Plant protein of unknown function (DUF936)